MNKTNIEWTTFTANPVKYRRKSDGKVVWACVKTSPGCAHCYSEAIALRFDRGKVFNAQSMEELEPFLCDDECRAMRAKKVIGGVAVGGSRCFIGDMTDIFGEWVSDDILNRLFSTVLEVRSDVTWQILTKRADRLCRYLSWRWGEGRIPCRHIHCGVSVEDQRRADERIPHLLRTPAAVRFLSCEPLLGPVDLRRLHFDDCEYDSLRGENVVGNMALQRGGPKTNWVIVGGESGPGARPMDLEWARSLVAQCRAAGVACFVKQLGRAPVSITDRISYRGNKAKMPDGFYRHLNDRKGGDPSEWPADLNVRQFPSA